ncbi:MAG: D-alanyl-D-alanine carboxypeptidase [Eubacteriales bacterium]|nr:D-alanyl-D-alanine carboxypeptidase [Eubacteriales bacterium]
MKFQVVIFAVFIAAVLLLAPVYGNGVADAEYVFAAANDIYGFENDSAVKTSAQSALLMDADSGRVLYAKNENTILPMASTTKIMTAVIILETLDMNSEIKVTKESVGIEGSSIYLMEGETLTVSELLYGLLLRSGNDAANALAVACAGNIENFANMMNRKAEELGLTHTRFANPSGLPDENHHTTAYDLAVLASYAIKNPDFVKITSTLRATISDGSRYLVNRNILLRSYEGMIGVKTGYTSAAGRCLVTAAKRDGVTLVAVTLNDGNIWNDHTAMLDYGFGFLESVTALKAGEVVTEMPVTGGKAASITASNTTDFICSVPKGATIYITIASKKILYAPISVGDIVGEVVIYADGIRVGSVPLVSSDNVKYKKLNFFERFLD